MAELFHAGLQQRYHLSSGKVTYAASGFGQVRVCCSLCGRSMPLEPGLYVRLRDAFLAEGYRIAAAMEFPAVCAACGERRRSGVGPEPETDVGD